MPGTTTPATLAHRILQKAHRLLSESAEAQETPLVETLTNAAGLLPDQEHLDDTTRDRALAEAAAHLLARCRIPIKVGDPTALYWLNELDQLPGKARLGLVTVALRHTAPDTPPAPTPTARHRRKDACPCSCNSGGFCGGCGHAGCGGHR